MRWRISLTISKRLTEMMDGEIGCASTPGAGSTFWFEVPLQKSTPEAAKLQNGSGHTTTGADPIGEREKFERNKSTRILVAEDNPTNLMVVRTMLEKVGYQVYAAADGREAVDAVQAFPYDAILMDVAMPEVDGIEATSLIRALSGGK